jgi:hypothetical protein
MFVIVYLVSTASFAHGGHDHANPMSSLIHLFWLAPLLLAVGMLTTIYVKRSHSSIDKNKE